FALAAAATGAILFFLWRHDDPALTGTLRDVTADYRRIIVLMDGAESLDAAARARAVAAGRLIFSPKRHALDDLARQLEGSDRAVRQFDHYLSSAPELHDADKLAFLDLVEALDTPGARNSPVKALHDNLLSIQLAYREEVTRIFSQFATRGSAATREK